MNTRSFEAWHIGVQVSNRIRKFIRSWRCILSFRYLPRSPQISYLRCIFTQPHISPLQFLGHLPLPNRSSHVSFPPLLLTTIPTFTPGGVLPETITPLARFLRIPGQHRRSAKSTFHSPQGRRVSARGCDRTLTYALEIVNKVPCRSATELELWSGHLVRHEASDHWRSCGDPNVSYQSIAAVRTARQAYRMKCQT